MQCPQDEGHARAAPLVRKIARENNDDLSQVARSGLGGRITKQDITAFLENSQSSSTPARSGGATAPAVATPAPKTSPPPRPFRENWCLSPRCARSSPNA